MAGNAVIQIRRDTAANWTAANPVLRLGELGFETDTKKLKVGDGVTAWTSLPYVTGGAGGVTSVNGQTGAVTLTKDSIGLGAVDNVSVIASLLGYRHDQTVASSTWTVNHNLGRKPAAVTVYSPGGQEVGANFLHNSDNQITVQFEQPQTGFVRVL